MTSSSQKQALVLTTTAAKQYTRQLHDFLRRRLRQPQDVDDLAQEVYMRLLRTKDDKVVSKPLAFLYGIAKHVLADFRIEEEAQRTDLTVSLEEMQDAQLEPPSPNSNIDDVERLHLQQQLEWALQQLRPIQAAVLVLVKRDGLSFEEVAKKLNLSVNMVHKHLKQAKVRLRTMSWER